MFRWKFFENNETKEKYIFFKIIFIYKKKEHYIVLNVEVRKLII
jgi:hypothetical protein